MSQPTRWSRHTLALIDAAIHEDLAREGDITSRLLPDGGRPIEAAVVARNSGVISGLTLVPWVCAAFSKRLQAELTVTAETSDGSAVRPGERVAKLVGPYAAVLSVERTLLNFLGRMSGVATLTARFVNRAIAVNPKVAILDTRKTVPGWRELDRYSVRVGGGKNHRDGLYDAVLIKDNHIGGVPDDEFRARVVSLIAQIFAKGSRLRPAFIEVEVDNYAQFEAACGIPGIGIILLDNLAHAQMAGAVRRRNALRLEGKVLLEASGNVTIENVASIAATGVDRISIGALTHSAPNFDVGLDFMQQH